MISNLVGCAILIVVLVAATIVIRVWARPVFTLVLWHNLVWAVALAFIAAPLINYTPSSWGAWLTLTTGLLAFNAGAVIIWQILERRGPRDSRLAKRWPLLREKPSYLTTRPIFWAALALYAVGFASYLINIQARFGIENLLLNPTLIRKGGADGVSYLESIPLPARLLLYLGPLLFAIVWYTPALNRPFRPLPRVLLTIALLLTMVALLQRSNLFIAILLTCALYITGPLPTPTRERGRGFFGSVAKWWDIAPQGVRIIGGLALLGVVGLAAFQSVGVSLGKTAVKEISSGAVSTHLAQTGLASPIEYYTAGSVAFLHLVDTTGGKPETWGASTFSLPLKFIPGVTHTDTISPFIDIGVRTNVYTWLELYYRDFGFVGVLVGSLAFGMLAGWLFIRRHRSSMMLWIQAAVFSTVFLAPFAPRINSALVATIVVYIVIVSLITRWRLTRQKESEPQFEGATELTNS